MLAAGMPTLRKPRSVGQPVWWWCLRPETWASPPCHVSDHDETIALAHRFQNLHE